MLKLNWYCTAVALNRFLGEDGKSVLVDVGSYIGRRTFETSTKEAREVVAIVRPYFVKGEPHRWEYLHKSAGYWQWSTRTIKLEEAFEQAQHDEPALKA